MKQLLMTFVVAGTLAIASCGSGTPNTTKTDTTVIVAKDTTSAPIANDSAKHDSVK